MVASVLHDRNTTVADPIDEKLIEILSNLAPDDLTRLIAALEG